MRFRLGRLLGWSSAAAVLAAAALIAAGSGGRSASEEADTNGVSMIEVEGEGSKYWSRWRGPSGQGWVEGGGYPDKWSPEENILWKVPVEGDGNSSPIIWGDRIFLLTSTGGGNQRSILCYRRSDGKMLWEAPAPSAEPERTYPKNGHASSTVATDGKRVYAYLGSAGLMAVDFEGKRVWHQSVGDVSAAFHGTAGSPLIYKDKLILYQDLRSGDSWVAAYDTASGRQLWRTPRPGKVGWGTPVAIKANGREEIIVSSMRTVFAYDPDTGGELWRCSGSLFEVIPTPVVGHGMVFASSGRAGPTLAIKPGGSGDVTETNLVWKVSKGSPFVPSPILYGENLYMVNDMLSIATCYEAKTGKVKWQGRMGKASREGFSASPVAFDGKIFFTNDDGQTFVLQAGDEFKVLHINELGERVLASPALVDGKWYFRTAKHLVAIGAS